VVESQQGSVADASCRSECSFLAATVDHLFLHAQSNTHERTNFSAALPSLGVAISLSSVHVILTPVFPQISATSPETKEEKARGFLQILYVSAFSARIQVRSPLLTADTPFQQLLPDLRVKMLIVRHCRFD
jgi:hypothetical protein